MNVAGEVIEGVLFGFISFLWVRFLTDWVQVFARNWEPRGVVLIFLELCYTITDPPVLGLRKVIKPIRIGSFALDLSFILVMITAYVLLMINRQALIQG